MNDYESKIMGIEKSEESSEIKLDLLRVLVVNVGARWKSDLFQDFKLFQDAVGRETKAHEDEFEGALEFLKNEGLIETEDRPKATRSGSQPDTLVSLSGPMEARKALSDDETLRKYRRQMDYNID